MRSISECLGYTVRGSSTVRNPTIPEMYAALTRLGQPTDKLGSPSRPSDLALLLQEYFTYRAETLNVQVESDLMNADEARAAFEEVKANVGAKPTGKVILSKSTGNESAVEYIVGESIVRVPLNKQKNEKKWEAYLTGIVNLLIAERLSGLPCDYDPRLLPNVDHNGTLYQTFSRRQDGSFPSTRNPIAMWEIKEYYYTTTFGSKISDAVYITSLDGYEREELERGTGITIHHLVMVDAYDTWWIKGRSYLCRMIDILNMGHVHDILFGREVIRELPSIVDDWVAAYRATRLD
ncbi:DUF7687 domain-containing protein [Mycobacterium avium]|uniref:DUF7687 domain-containing protein n=1 Tax=Mycobacterium avium TaxID=1764 RepID=UPI003F5ECE8C